MDDKTKYLAFLDELIRVDIKHRLRTWRDTKYMLTKYFKYLGIKKYENELYICIFTEHSNAAIKVSNDNPESQAGLMSIRLLNYEIGNIESIEYNEVYMTDIETYTGMVSEEGFKSALLSEVVVRVNDLLQDIERHERIKCYGADALITCDNDEVNILEEEND